MLAHGADRLEEPEWESGSFFFVKIKCLPRNKMLTEKQNAYRETECLSRNRMLTEIQNVCRETKNTHTGKQHIYKKQEH